MIRAPEQPTLFAPPRFFVHPVFDYALIGGGLSLVFAVGMAIFALDLTLSSWLAVLFIVANGAHFAASSLRLYTRPGIARTHPLLTLAFPLLAALALSAAIVLPEPLGLFLLATYLVWSPYHYAAQAYGLAVMYGYRAGVALDEGAKRSIRIVCLVPFAWTLLQPAGGLGMLLSAWHVAAPAPVEQMRGVVSQGLISLTLFAPVALVLWLRARHGIALPLISVVTIVSNALWWTFFNILDAFLWATVFHGLQYLAIVTIFHVKDRQRDPGARHGAGWHALTFYLGAVLIGYVLFELWPSVYAWAGYDLTRSVLLVTAAINIHHFVVDAYIWRLRRDPNYANVVDASRTAETADVRAALPTSRLEGTAEVFAARPVPRTAETVEVSAALPTNGASRRARWPRRFVLMLTVLLFVLWGAGYIYRTSAMVGGERVFVLWDDAMISMRYARNLASGHQFTWNPDGERVQGISNPGVTIAMTALHLLPIDVRYTSLVFQVFCLAMAGACLPLVYRLALVLSDEPLVGQGAAALTACYAPFAIWSLQGADIPAVALPLLGALLLAVRNVHENRPWPLASFVLLALGILVRPDSVVVYLVMLAFCGWREGFTSARLLKGCALLAAVGVGLLVFSYVYYGDPLPNTYYLKATGTPRLLMLLNGLHHSLDFVSTVSPVLILLVVAAVVGRHGVSPGIALCAAVVLSSFAYNLWVGGDWVPGLPSRFVVPALPIFIVLVVTAWGRLARRLADEGRWRWLYGAGILVLVLQLNPAGALMEWLSFSEATLLKSENVSLIRRGFYVRDHTDLDTTVAFHWGGTSAYFGERTGIDVLGKSDRHIAKMTVDRFLPGHSKWDWDYVMRERRPDLFQDQSRGLMQRDDFRQGYRAARNAHGDWMFVRKGAEVKIHDPRLAYFDIASLREIGPGL